MPVPPVFLVVTKHYAFPEVFQHLHQDMKQVERFLEAGKVGDPTQNIEIDIIDTLKEMVNSLKK